MLKLYEYVAGNIDTHIDKTGPSVRTINICMYRPAQACTDMYVTRYTHMYVLGCTYVQAIIIGT